MAQNMIKLEQVVKSINSLPRLVNIRQYIPVKEKLELANEYNKLFKEHINDYEEQTLFVGYIFLRMIIIKGYTNIDFNFTYDDYDILEKHGIINKVIELIGDDYNILMKVISCSNIDESK